MDASPKGEKAIHSQSRFGRDLAHAGQFAEGRSRQRAAKQKVGLCRAALRRSPGPGDPLQAQRLPHPHGPSPRRVSDLQNGSVRVNVA